MPDLPPRTVYRYGSMEHGHYGHVVLDASGLVRCYDHPNERRWVSEGDAICFVSDSGSVTSVFRPDGNSFFSSGANLRYLLPVLTITDRGDTPWGASVFVNTVQKSGTYLVDHVLDAIGYRRLGLHLGSLVFDDNRGVEAASVHWRPEERRAPCPARCVAALMRPGEFVVGHVESLAELRAIEEAGVRIVSVVRDLRAVIASLYSFKRKSVACVSPSDMLWRGLSGDASLAAFLAEYASRDMVHVKQMAEVMAWFSPLKYEDFVSGNAEGFVKSLELVDTGLGEAFKAQLPLSLDQPTSTFSGRRRASPSFGAGLTSLFAPSTKSLGPGWPDFAESFFADFGLADLNGALGYKGRVELD